jgi:hypothetical protein
MERIAAAAALALLLAPAAAAQRESSWAAPTSADWKRPPLPQWQRNFDDALAVSKATNRPILICVNMDGEAASENYAGLRYRDADFAKLMTNYVPVIVSPSRHAPRDYDEAGRRVVCPRFGRVTCAEHIAIEPILFAKYFKGERVAPRHIGVGTDGKAIFDMFLNTDVAPVRKALQEHGGRAPGFHDPPPAFALVKSRDSQDRAYVEENYIKSDANWRKQLLAAAADAKDAEPFDLLRLGLHDQDPDIRAAARKALAKTATANAVPLLVEALRFAKDADERKGLSDALLALSKNDLRARVAAAVTRALAEKPTVIDAAAWRAALAKAKNTPAPADDPDALELAIQDASDRARKNPNDGRASLDLARATIRFAEARMEARKDPNLLFADAKKALDDAAAHGEKGGELDAARALLLHHQGKWEEAAAAAQAALPGLLGSAASREAAESLWLAARGIRGRIAKALATHGDFDAIWVTNAHGLSLVLEAHPLARPEWLAEDVDSLVSLDAPEVARETLDRALARFPDSAALHERLRARLLEDHGLAALEQDYERRVAAAPGSAPLQWFAGYATIVAAEYEKRAGETQRSKDAFTRAIQHFDKSLALNAEYKDNSDHYAGMALAGRAQVEADEGDLDAAVADLTAALARKPTILETEDGFGRTPMLTIRALRYILDDKKRADLREKLEASLEAIDPDLASRPAK